jgi:hypothetical protein
MSLIRERIYLRSKNQLRVSQNKVHSQVPYRYSGCHRIRFILEYPIGSQVAAEQVSFPSTLKVLKLPQNKVHFLAPYKC